MIMMIMIMMIMVMMMTITRMSVAWSALYSFVYNINAVYAHPQALLLCCDALNG